uniref:Uncharacterized protein n=1 Tax=Magallana gigas TaxID=29159 RepID=A0A8W8NCI5_MAGGI
MARMQTVVHTAKLRVICILLHIFLREESWHLVVTEDDQVQAQSDTIFSMKLPCDLVAFMRQEEGSGIPEKLKEELLSRKDAYEIDKNDDRDTDIPNYDIVLTEDKVDSRR